MAKFYPPMSEIMPEDPSTLAVQPTEGELFLLRVLEELDDAYEVYFQPYINLDHPDVVILRRGHGALVIEVKDWHLEKYTLSPDETFYGCLREKAEGNEIRSPFAQVHGYKAELYNLYSVGLCLGSFVFVQTAVYFHNASREQVEGLFGRARFAQEKYHEYNFRFWTREPERILQEIDSLFPYRRNFYDEIYEQLHTLFTPSLVWREQNEPLILSARQRELAESQPKRQQKIKGVAGSGKTVVLAQRAVNCHKRTGRPVLVLTYNITLMSYIRDRISQAAREEGWSGRYKSENFFLMYAYQFFKSMIDVNGLVDPVGSRDPLKGHIALRIKALSSAASRFGGLQKYQTILIDEVQDFEPDWLKAIKELFLVPDGELVLFGDEKQNIYGRTLENKLPRTPVKGTWTTLKVPYRMTRAVSLLAQDFQKEFLNDKYNSPEMEFVQEDLFTGPSRLLYYDVSRASDALVELYRIIDQFRRDAPVSPNDICVLCGRHESLQEVEYRLRTELKMATCPLCETREEFQKVISRLHLEEEARANPSAVRQRKDVKTELEAIHRIKKFAFQMNPGVIKLSTIHSFKGWEIDTAVLWLDDAPELSDELVYTALTRARHNLVVVNCRNTRYGDFFRERLSCPAAAPQNAARCP